LFFDGQDLPSRETDKEFPVVGVRYGRWKIKAGDNQAYAQASYNDADWLSAEGGTDWRFMHNLNPLMHQPRSERQPYYYHHYTLQ